MSATARATEQTKYFEGYVAGIMNYDTPAEALAASSRPCLNENTDVTNLILKVWEFEKIQKFPNLTP